MRSVVVVLPASMWALMPMFRYRSMGVVLATFFRCLPLFAAVYTYASRKSLPAHPSPLVDLSRLEPEMREGLVRFGHAVHFLALFHRTAATFGCFQKLGREALPHRLFATLARRLAQPAHGQRNATDRADFDRNLEIGATDATAFYFDHRLGIGQRLGEHFQRVLAALLGDRFERAVHDALGNRFLALAHQHVDELGDVAVRVLRIGQDLALGYFSASGHL